MTLRGRRANNFVELKVPSGLKKFGNLSFATNVVGMPKEKLFDM